MKDSPPLSSRPQLGVCCTFIYQVWPVNTSPLHFLAPRFSQCDLFQTWLSSSHLTVGTFNGFPELLLVCLRLHLMLWGSFATPVHFYPQDTVFHTCQAFAPSLHLLSVPCLVCSPVALCLATSSFRLHMDSSRKTS